MGNESDGAEMGLDKMFLSPSPKFKCCTAFLTRDDFLKLSELVLAEFSEFSPNVLIMG